ncbi:PDDEXK family nuclease [Saccharomonospora iraqiensis]|uniref:hypothetical protein n=1 Tax=Saccharomonospora iraqiensis TaxID=52698 RepID=UPI000423D8F7|nr:hypothetical protein [Saccharomonospora iraqiensis]
MSGDEALVVRDFCAWLAIEGWQVETEVEHVDVVATRDGQRLYAEAKGKTTDPGLDVDTAFGQLLRRMPKQDDASFRYGLVVRDEPRSVRAVQRVPSRVLTLLRITLYAVAEDGAVRELTGHDQ